MCETELKQQKKTKKTKRRTDAANYTRAARVCQNIFAEKLLSCMACELNN